MSKGDRANLDRLLRRAWETQCRQSALAQSAPPKDRTTVKVFGTAVKVLVGSAAVGLAATLITAALAVYGVVNISTARILLGLAGFVLVGGIATSDYFSAKSWRHICLLTALSALVIGSGLVSVDGWAISKKAEHDSQNAPAPIKPFALTLSAPQISEEPLFWRLNGTRDIRSSLLCPGKVLVYLTITNQKSSSAMVNQLKIAMKKVDGNWEDLFIVEREVSSTLYAGTDVRKLIAYRGDFLDIRLKGYNIAPGETVSGWLILDYPQNHVPMTVLPEFKVAISDMTMASPDIYVLLPGGVPSQEPTLVIELSGYQDLSMARRATTCPDWY
jgi:hypothetical protein